MQILGLHFGKQNCDQLCNARIVHLDIPFAAQRPRDWLKSALRFKRYLTCASLQAGYLRFSERGRASEVNPALLLVSSAASL